MAGALLLAFGWWGVETPAGRHRFDEMAGIIPEAARALGALLLLVAVVLYLAGSMKRER